MPALTPPKPPVPHRRPLPDAVAIWSMPVPLSAPPYDDDLPGGYPSANRAAASANWAAPSANAAVPAANEAAPATNGAAQATNAAAPYSSRPVPAPVPAPVPVPVPVPDLARPAPLRDPPGHWPSQFAQVLAETLAGSRPANQIAPWTTDQTRRRISRLGPALSTTHRPRVKRVVVTSPAGGVLELAIVVGFGTKVRALAVRLERLQHPSDQPQALSQRCAPSQPYRDSAPKTSNRPNPATDWICTAIEAA